jgi:parvulin-like peptidyl-prolyl isomerase
VQRIRSALREPLLHFFLIGLLLFLYEGWRGGSGAGSTRITISSGLVQHLASGFARTWQRPPTDDELKGLVDEHVKEEIAAREAAAMGLDRDDTIIRRRLRQKLEFLVEDEADQAPATDAELQSWLDAHPDAFPSEPTLGLRQVYLSREKRGADARAHAERLLARLRAAGPGAATEALGDESMLPAELPPGPLSEVSRAFGAEFAARVNTLAPGRWEGPLESPYGLHLVLVTEKAAAERPALAEIRPQVDRELQAERRRARLQAHYERLLEKYSVSIEMPKRADSPQAASQGVGSAR